MTSATDELRRLLDDRGVEHVDAEDGHTQHTWWSDGDHEVAASNSGERLAVYNLTPAQAVEATLGPGTCHAVFEVDAMSEDERIGEYVCSECGETFGDGRDQRPNYCPNCGRKVVE